MLGNYTMSKVKASYPCMVTLAPILSMHYVLLWLFKHRISTIVTPLHTHCAGYTQHKGVV